MCILFLAINRHPDYPLIIAANRDEHFARPSQAMHYWPDQPNILAGRDALKGGSWLGVNRSGQFCAVTNFRAPELMKDEAKSRGELVARFLENGETEDEFIEYLESHYQEYNPFNLVFGNKKQLSVFSSQTGKYRALSDGFHSVSNGEIDQPWPKMSMGVQRLTELIRQNQPIEFDSLNAIMLDDTQAEDSHLPATGVTLEVEKALSSIFIRGETYGTRTTSLLFFDSDTIHIREINYDADSVKQNEQDFIVSTLEAH